MMLSLAAIALNEAHNAASFVASVQKHVDEIIVVDTGSTDDTVAILESLGCTVLHTTMDNGFGAAKNMAKDACQGEWVLSLDFDERPSESLMRWVRSFVERAKKTYGAASFERDNLIDDELVSVERHVRLFRRTSSEWQGMVHEQVSYSGRCYRAPDGARIIHSKTSEKQDNDSRRYLQYYPKLNIGSGGRPMPIDEGWINYDIDPNAPDAEMVDVFTSLPLGLPAAHIQAFHILEHASYHRAAQVLSMWISHLAPGGTIEIRVPDLDGMVKGFYEGTLHYLVFLQGMYGGQTAPQDYHCIAINEGWLRGQLNYWGCVDIKRLPTDKLLELRMTARKPL